LSMCRPDPLVGHRRCRTLCARIVVRSKVSKEPRQLRRGKIFQREVQDDWVKTAEGRINVECTIPLLKPIGSKSLGRLGRMDILVDDMGDQVAVVEIKATDWDRILAKNITKNLGSHRRQIYKYIEKYLDGEGKSVCPGLIYPTAPETPGLKERIEKYLNDYGIAVAWYRD